MTARCHGNTVLLKNKNNYLLPGVEFKGGDADLFDLVFGGSKQQVPMRSGWQGYLGTTGTLDYDI